METFNEVIEFKKQREILDGKFDFFHGEIADGDFGPTKPEFHDRLNAVREARGLQFIFAPSLNFTQRVGSLTDEKEQVFIVGPKGGKVKYAEEGILRTLNKADGGVIFMDDLESIGIPMEKVAVAAANADCPFIIGYESEKRAFFMLHAGLGCLYKAGENEKHTIFQDLVERWNLNPAKMKIFVTAGIQKCCYGRDDTMFQGVFNEWGGDLKSVASMGSRTGQTSLDLSGMIVRDLERVGVPGKNVEVDTHCTCCDGKHFSNVKGDKGRNLLLVNLHKQ